MILRYVISLMFLAVLSNESFGADKCERNIYKTLRYGHVYTFDHTLTTHDGAIKVVDFLPEMNEKFDFDGKASSIDFKWTEEILKNDGIVEPNQSLVFVRAAQPYEIKFRGKTRAIDDITFKYITKYKKKNANGGWSTQVETDTVCVNYAITWCGDGVVDTAHGETCDNGSQNGEPGNQCSKTCEKTSN